MFLKKLAAFFAVLMLLLALSACGGGDEVVVNTPAPAASAPVTAEAEVTFTQFKTALTVLPGGTVSGTVLEATCKGVSKEGYCPELTRTGEITLESSIELVKATFTWSDGTIIEGDFNDEGAGKYRFVPHHNYNYVWRKETLTVDVTVSPYAKAGQYTLLVLEVGSPAPDKKIEVKRGQASLTVREAPGNSPMTISSSDAYQSLVYSDKSAPYVEYKVSGQCADGTSCDFSVDFDGVTGLQPGTPVQLCNQWGCWDGAYADEQGTVSFDLWLHHGSGNVEYTIRLYPNSEYVGNGWQFGLFATSIDAWVGDEEILPKLGTSDAPTHACTVTTSNYCKG